MYLVNKLGGYVMLNTVSFQVEKSLRDCLFRMAKNDCVSVSEALRMLIYREGLRRGDSSALAMKRKQDVERSELDKLVAK